jgi:predicted nucleotidyltransferase component of viral defense system
LANAIGPKEKYGFMLKEIISRKTQSNLEILNQAGILNGYYLAGGTGLALQLKHRLSIDLDFFTANDVDIERLSGLISKLGNFLIEKKESNSLICQLNGTRLSFLEYGYPLLLPLKKINNALVASLEDIACMKIDAISSRGVKKDFIDLFFICKKVSLSVLLKLFAKKYKNINYNSGHILKSLIYFNDAEKEPLPFMVIPVSWSLIKSFFKKEVKKILSEN